MVCCVSDKDVRNIGVGIMKKAVLICFSVFVVGLIILMCAILPRIMSDKELTSIPNCTDVKPYCVANGTLFGDDTQVNIWDVCKKHNKDFTFKDVLYLSDEQVYFVCSDTSINDYKWVLASLDIETEEITEHYVFDKPSGAYLIDHVAEYSKRNGYYYDGKIVLTDYVNIIEYDVETSMAQQYDYIGYEFPELTILGECIDSQTIKVYNGKESAVFTLKDMANVNNEILKLYSMGNKKTWDGTSCLAGFFSDRSIQTDGENIYAIGNCANFSGESYGIILFYDNQTNQWQYITAVYTGDYAHGHCYIVSTK